MDGIRKRKGVKLLTLLTSVRLADTGHSPATSSQVTQGLEGTSSYKVPFNLLNTREGQETPEALPRS